MYATSAMYVHSRDCLVVVPCSPGQEWSSFTWESWSWAVKEYFLEELLFLSVGRSKCVRKRQARHWWGIKDSQLYRERQKRTEREQICIQMKDISHYWKCCKQSASQCQSRKIGETSSCRNRERVMYLKTTMKVRIELIQGSTVLRAHVELSLTDSSREAATRTPTLLVNQTYDIRVWPVID